MWKSHLEYSAKLRQNIIHSTVNLDVGLFQQNMEFSKHNHIVTTTVMVTEKIMRYRKHGHSENQSQSPSKSHSQSHT